MQRLGALVHRILRDECVSSIQGYKSWLRIIAWCCADLFENSRGATSLVLMSITKDILRHWALTAQIVLNILIGYLFIKFLASNWGASAHKDAFDVAYSIPFLVISVSGVTFLEAVITTQFTSMRRSEGGAPMQCSQACSITCWHFRHVRCR